MHLIASATAAPTPSTAHAGVLLASAAV